MELEGFGVVASAGSELFVMMKPRRASNVNNAQPRTAQQGDLDPTDREDELVSCDQEEFAQVPDSIYEA